MLLLFFFASLFLLLLAAEGFVNGVEWLGFRLRLSEGVVGSLLAAVGTALPETMIPVLALLMGGDAASLEIGMGAVLGAPFMLSTLALCLTGLVAMGCRRPVLWVDSAVIRRDLLFFLVVYSLAVSGAFWASGRVFLALSLFLLYGVYVKRTIGNGRVLHRGSLKPLYLQRLLRREGDPYLAPILLQLVAAIVVMVSGANLFIETVGGLAILLGISPLLLSLVIAPVATELPEKFNSVLWILRGKNTLALGNITGAMVFQSSLLPAVAMLLTPWAISGVGLLSVLLSLSAGTMLFVILCRGVSLRPIHLIGNGFFYLVFLILLFS